VGKGGKKAKGETGRTISSVIRAKTAGERCQGVGQREEQTNVEGGNRGEDCISLTENSKEGGGRKNGTGEAVASQFGRGAL